MLAILIIVGLLFVALTHRLELAGGQSVMPGYAQVIGRERLAGSHPSVIAVFDAWEAEGTFHLQVGGGDFPNGGKRDAEDVAKALALGVSNAPSLTETAHGRGAGGDGWPLGFNPWKTFSEQPGMFELFKLWNAHCKRHGMVTGENFNIVAPDGVRGDWSHFELPHWHDLPFPGDYNTTGERLIS